MRQEEVGGTAARENFRGAKGALPPRAGLLASARASRGACDHSMTETAPSAYDAVMYPGVAFEQTHPNRLASIASLFGMRSAPPSRCRVLELGCGIGANLIPMAYQYPQSEFVGIDLSAPTIAQGRAQAAACDLANIALKTGDIMDVDAGFGMFDYVIAHGVYSWVPAAVRAKILTILRERMNPHGVGFISFNAYPGSHLRDLGRGIMHYHVRRLGDPAAQVRQGRALLAFMAEASDAGTVYGAALRGALAHTGQKSDEVLYHDDLNPDAEAFLLHRVVEDAERSGLQYLSEAVFAHSTYGAAIDKGGGFIEHIPAEEVVAREQYLDLFMGRWFHEALFCRADVALRRAVDPQCVRRFFMSLAQRPAASDGDAALAPGVAAAVGHLERIWPQAADFDALAEAGGFDHADRDALAAALFDAYRQNRIELHAEPPRLAAKPGERPRASLLARTQAQAGPLVANLRHETIRLDEVLHPFLRLVDGTRDIDALAAALDDLLAAREGAADAPRAAANADEARSRAAQALDALAKLALLLE
jgi:SAM-dependent methyltransferase